jgi:hypothetical protein
VIIPKVIPSAKVVANIYNGHWEFPTQMGLHPKMGFIYLIKDEYLERFYIGKKLYRGTGKENRGKESNWKTYTSSSGLIRKMLIERPKEEFRFICLDEYETKGGLAWAETWSLVNVNTPRNNKTYNTSIPAINWKSKEDISQRHCDRLQEFLYG